MKSQIIFETEILLVRRLKMSDIKPYHEMQSNPKVMQYVTGEVQTEKEHLIELDRLIGFYDKKGNDFWIYAIDRKLDNEFIGTVGFCKDEDGFFLEATLDCYIPDVDTQKGEQLVNDAHQMCPFSKATRDNITCSCKTKR